MSALRPIEPDRPPAEDRVTLVEPAHSLTPDEQQKLTEGLDKVLALLAGKPIEIVGGRSTQKAYAFGIWNHMRQAGKRRRKCVFPGCAEKSIPASHTLQRNGPLAMISEENHVLTPSFDIRTCEHTMTRIGIGRASTFPGFCEEHERFFAELETRQALVTDSDVGRQVFRTICREVVTKRQECEDLKFHLRLWQLLIGIHGWKIVADTIGPEMTSKLKLGPFSTGGTSKIELFLAQAAQDSTEHVHYLETVMLPASLDEVEGREPGLAHVVLRVAQPLPVCLAGLGNFHTQEGDRIDSIQAMLNVWPSSNGTCIVASAEARHNERLKDYFYSGVSRSLGPLEMVETWMTNGTNHWFITPSVWSAIPTGRAQRIVAHIGETRHGLGTPYHLSIFDALRLAALREDDCDGFDRADEERKLVN